MPLPFHRRRLDPDAADFCRRSGATDRAAINAFVRGVKDLGLWNNMVCWPLRSSQNKGTGTTAYSLGGLGTYNGSLIDGPVWTAGGISFDGSNDYITTGITYSWNKANTLFAAVFRTEDKLVPRVFGSPSNPNTPLFFRIPTTQFIGAFNGSPSYSFMATPLNNTWNSISVAYNATEANAVLNTTSTSVASSFAAVTQDLTIAGGQVIDSNYWPGTIAIGAYFDADIGIANQTALANLYKSTLGTGLGLP